MADCRSNEPSDYTVGIICALDKELLAIRCLLDSMHPVLCVSRHDTNSYTLGSIAQHAVVMTCLPAGEYGTNSAASVASQMRMSFPAVDFCLLVGIAGGIPGKQDIRLGDVVVSLPVGVHSGVVQHDMGKAMPGDSFVKTGSLQRPPRVLLGAINSLRSNPHLTANPLQQYVDTITRLRPVYSFPGRHHDLLFEPHCINDDSAASCDEHLSFQVCRTPREPDYPHIHYGLVGSGNTVVKDATLRDCLAEKYNILCFEMEAAGVLNVMPTLVIRGICDYCDSHKSKLWQEYAAATAAAYAKVLLCEVRAQGTTCPSIQASPLEQTGEPYKTTNPPKGLVSVHPVDVPFRPLVSQPAPQRPQLAADILRKAQSFAERRALWNDIPTDAVPLMIAFKKWAETSSSSTLILEPQGPSAQPRAEDFAFETISLLNSQAQPVIWALCPASSEPLTEDDIVHCLVEQLGHARAQPWTGDTPVEAQEILLNTLPIALDNLGRFFFVLAIKHVDLISSVLTILDAIQSRADRCVKILMVSYSNTRWNQAALPPQATFQRLSPPPPKGKRKRAIATWLDTVQATV